MSNVISITNGDIESLRLIILPFHTVRKEAFVKLIQLSFRCERTAAEKIVEKLIRKRAFHQGMYAGFKIIRAHPEELSDMGALDAFEAYIALLEQEKEKSETAGIYTMRVEKMEYPHDYVFATTTGTIYEVLVFNDAGYQKLAFSERSSRKMAGDVVKLVVITSQVDEEDASKISISGPHRLALVRKQEANVVCALTDVIKED